MQFGWDASSFQVNADIYSFTHRFTPRGQFSLANLVTSMFLGGGGKAGEPKESHTDRRRTYMDSIRVSVNLLSALVETGH